MGYLCITNTDDDEFNHSFIPNDTLNDQSEYIRPLIYHKYYTIPIRKHAESNRVFSSYNKNKMTLDSNRIIAHTIRDISHLSFIASLSAWKRYIFRARNRRRSLSKYEKKRIKFSEVYND
jgi:hypothetical protein